MTGQFAVGTAGKERDSLAPDIHVELLVGGVPLDALTGLDCGRPAGGNGPVSTEYGQMWEGCQDYRVNV